ncbi:MAG: flagellar basal body P-ring protein FlgI [Pirellulaceae bacterium]|nr:flagellar basal body P-ring protein FlgI [Pirellulaceae bacterium]
MMPRTDLPWARPRALTLALLVMVGGCASPLFFRGQSPEPEDAIPEQPEGVRLIGDMTSPWGTNYVKLESVGLVNGLDGTGSDPPPGPQTAMLLQEMQTHEVHDPQKVLSSDTTSLVEVRGWMPPGIQEGEHFDIEVRVPPRSKSASLRGGWLMRSRLRELAVLDNELHSGSTLGLAEGQVLVDALFRGGDDAIHEKRGRILGGGVALKSRPLGLVVRRESSSILTSKAIGTAVNARFYSYNQGSKEGVATPKRDNFIELRVHPRYRHNLERYVRVVRSIALGESQAERAERLLMLERMLLEPTTAAKAALQLEAIGEDAVPVLRKGLESVDAEVRFYAAEALAYQDQVESVGHLVHAAADEPAFRWHALTALAAIDHVAAYDALTGLLNARSAEARYGAFHAMRVRNRRDPLVKGEILNGSFSFHVLSTNADPMVHFTRSRRAEIVVFGHEQRLEPPAFLYAGPQILIKGMDGERLKISRFAPGKEDQQEVCSTRVDDVVRCIARLGGGYAEVLEALMSARSQGYLTSRVLVDARPRQGRTYRRDEPVEAEPSTRHAETPVPGMFRDLLEEDQGERPSGESDGSGNIDPSPVAARQGFFGRMTGWWR